MSQDINTTIKKELYCDRSKESLEIMKRTASKIISDGGCCNGISCADCCMGVRRTSSDGLVCFRAGIGIPYSTYNWYQNKVRLAQDFLNLYYEPKTLKVDVYD